MSSHLKQLLKFGYAGALGFVVDTSVLYACLYGFGLGYYSGRVVSYFFAVTTTWYLNRKYTFRSTNEKIYSEWTRFFIVNLSGGAINYATYSLAIYFSVPAKEHPIIGVALGSIAGLFVNFALSKFFVFHHKEKTN